MSSSPMDTILAATTEFLSKTVISGTIGYTGAAALSTLNPGFVGLCCVINNVVTRLFVSFEKIFIDVWLQQVGPRNRKLDFEKRYSIRVVTTVISTSLTALAYGLVSPISFSLAITMIGSAFLANALTVHLKTTKIFESRAAIYIAFPFALPAYFLGLDNNLLKERANSV